ncbi:hypothetical protein [Lysobacter gummosus]|uniref:Transmembrane protein n=1 Tax=Lysobacter gummosus TaxID=262324 RepID=A0ABY3X679_9GAMM|nr:hypothetical protein [Lysobacter gummosus]UNP28078.1 hypothetical protein MOV92_16440 [Lysobacter gummosus]
MRWIAGAFVTVALAMVSASGVIFFCKLGKSYSEIAVNDMANFGTYFGGVAGPLLAFLTVAGLALTMMMQNRQLEQVAEANLKDQHIRMLIEIGHDIAAMEVQHIDGNITLGNVLNEGGQLGRGNVGALRKLLPRYVKVLGLYAKSVALYRVNISPDFDCKAFEQRGLRLLDRVEPHAEYLGQMGGPALATIRGHLENTLRTSESADTN